MKLRRRSERAKDLTFSMMRMFAILYLLSPLLTAADKGMMMMGNMTSKSKSKVKGHSKSKLSNSTKCKCD